MTRHLFIKANYLNLRRGGNKINKKSLLMTKMVKNYGKNIPARYDRPDLPSPLYSSRLLQGGDTRPNQSQQTI